MNEKLETTPESQTAHLDAINKATLTPLMRSALNSATAEVTKWGYEQLHTGAGWGTAVYRFSGEARDGDRDVPWLLILKGLRPEGGSPDPSAWSYYKREADAYRSGWLANLPGDVVAPRCYGIVDDPDGTSWLWLEHIIDDIGAEWPVEHYGIAARHPGQFNGAYLVDGTLPSWAWLTSGLVRGVAARGSPEMAPHQGVLAPHLVQRWLPGEASGRLFRIFEDLEQFVDALERVPPTLCHCDAFRRNVFARARAGGGYKTALVDWEWAGRGPVGFDLIPLVHGSVIFFEADVGQVRALEAIAYQGYLEGLRDASWRGDPRQVRLGYTAGSVRYRGQIWRGFMDFQDGSPDYSQLFGHTTEECCDC